MQILWFADFSGQMQTYSFAIIIMADSFACVCVCKAIILQLKKKSFLDKPI